MSLFAIDLIAYIFMLIGIKNILFTWFFIGNVIGVLSGVLPTLNTRKKENINLYTIVKFVALTLMFIGYLATNLKSISC
jgi:hypothetical protein